MARLIKAKVNEISTKKGRQWTSIIRPFGCQIRAPMSALDGWTSGRFDGMASKPSVGVRSLIWLAPALFTY
jgi:hypothetical protein